MTTLLAYENILFSLNQFIRHIQFKLDRHWSLQTPMSAFISLPNVGK